MTLDTAMPDMGLFCNRLKRVRKSYGVRIGNPDLTIKDFADMLGIQGAAYANYERGTREPSLSVLTAIHKLTGADLTELVAGAGEAPPRLCLLWI